MTTLADIIAATLTTLADHGITATTDPRDLTVPGVLLMPDRIEINSLDRTGITASWEMWLVAPDTDPWPHLSQLAEKVAATGYVTTFNAISVNLTNHSPDPLPALQCQLEMRYTND